MDNEKLQYSFFENNIGVFNSKHIDRWIRIIKKKFSYDAEENYFLTAVDNSFISEIFNIKNIVRSTEGRPVEKKNGIVICTIRIEYRHFRNAIAAASCANAMGFTPYWLDLVSIPGITTEIISYSNSKSIINKKFLQFKTLIKNKIRLHPNSINLLLHILNFFNYITTNRWKIFSFKRCVRNQKMTELFKNLFIALPADMPCITSHSWCSMSAVSAGMTNVVNLISENIPLISNLSEGAMHSVSSQSAYYGLRMFNISTGQNRIFKPVPKEFLSFTGNHIDHELVQNIESDCRLRINRSRKEEPRRFLLTMNDSDFNIGLFRSIIEHSIPLAQQNKASLFINLGDNSENWNKLQKHIAKYGEIIQLHSSWDDTKSFADKIRTAKLPGSIHVFLHDNIYQAVYASNYLMRVADVMITDPCELAAYPVPKILNASENINQKWSAVRSSEIGDGTLECQTHAQTLQAIDIITEDSDILELFCECIVKNKSIGLYDGAYKAVSMATGMKFDRSKLDKKKSPLRPIKKIKKYNKK